MNWRVVAAALMFLTIAWFGYYTGSEQQTPRVLIQEQATFEGSMIPTIEPVKVTSAGGLPAAVPEEDTSTRPADVSPELASKLTQVAEAMAHQQCGIYPEDRISQDSKSECDASALAFIANLNTMCKTKPPAGVERTYWDFELKDAKNQEEYHLNLQRLQDSYSTLLQRYNSDRHACTEFGHYRLNERQSNQYRELAARLGHRPSLQNYVMNAIMAFHSKQASNLNTHQEVFPLDKATLSDPNLQMQIAGVLEDLETIEPHLAAQQRHLYESMQSQSM